jgi:hypothetical protein
LGQAAEQILLTCDGHTLGTVIPQMQALIGNIVDRCITDAGCRGHNAPKFKVYTSG